MCFYWKNPPEVAKHVSTSFPANCLLKCILRWQSRQSGHVEYYLSHQTNLVTLGFCIIANWSLSRRKATDSGNPLVEEIVAQMVNKIESMYRMAFDYLATARLDDTNLLEECLLLERDRVLGRVNTIDELRVVVIAGIDSSSIIMIFWNLLTLVIRQRML